MPLILRKCNEDGSSRNGFVYGKTGDTVTAPDWHPEPLCGKGLHGLLNASGAWGLLEGTDWLVFVNRLKTSILINLRTTEQGVAEIGKLDDIFRATLDYRCRLDLDPWIW